MAGGLTFKQIAASLSQTCGITTAGAAYCWGSDTNGKLGNGATTGDQVSPVAVTGGLVFNQISMGDTHACGITTSGVAYCWGSDSNGQIGNGATTGDQVSPAAVTGSYTFSQIAAGTNYTCGIVASGAAYCWGSDSNGQLGNGATTGNQNSPVTVTGGLNYKQISAGYSHACAIATNDAAYCWGSDSNGQLGNGATTGDQADPSAVTGGMTFKQISNGANFTCGLTTGNIAYCWGNDSLNYQLGNGATTGDQDSPSAVTPLVQSGGVTGITFGGTAATDINVTSMTTVTAKVPAHAAGLVSVVITNSEGSNTLTNSYTYVAPPSVTGVSPTSGPQAGGNTVTITGTDFYQGIEFRQIISGINYTCGLTMTNKVYCWGSNQYGQLGSTTNSGKTNANNTPQLVQTGSMAGKAITQLAAGDNHVCALASDSTVHCWGLNQYGQLGNLINSTTTNANNVPMQVQAGSMNGKTITRLTAGNNHTCALASDNTIHCWGSNYYGQLGSTISSGSGAVNATPLFAQTGTIGTKTVAEITAGSSHTCARATDNTLHCWGVNQYGQLGNTTNSGNGNPNNAPLLVQAGSIGSKTLAQIAAGGNHTCARATDNTLHCWGRNDAGQLGNTTNSGNNNPNNAPLATTLTGLNIPQVYFGDSPATNITYGSATSLTATAPSGSTGSADVKVINPDGQANANTASDDYTYIGAPVVSSIFPSTVVTTGGDTVTITGSGFGSADTYTVNVNGSSITATYVSPTELSFVTPSGLSNDQSDIYVTSSLGGKSNVLVDGLTYVRPVPTIASVAPTAGPLTGNQKITLTGTGFYAGKEFKQLSSGANHACGVTAGGQLYCWGLNSSYQLGDGTGATQVLPVNTSRYGALVGKTVKQVAAGETHTCALTTEPKVYCWGLNNNYQLGTGTTSTSTIPIAVDISASSALNGKTIAQIATEANHTCAIDTLGKVYCWGLGTSYQLGNNTTAQTTLPVRVDSANTTLGAKTATSLAVGNNFTCALTTESKAYCWGVGSNGQLGDGASTARGLPVLVAPDATSPLYNKTITSVASGGTHACATTTEGKVYCWGANGNGQLGDESTTQRAVPMLVDPNGNSPLSSKVITGLSLGASHSCALSNDGKVYCWGLNSSYQIGDGTNTQRTIPVLVSGSIASKTIRQLSAGNTDSCALATDGSTYCWGANGSGQAGIGSGGAIAAPTTPVAMNQVATMSLLIGGVPATGVTYVNATTATAITPAHAAGVVTAALTNGDGQASAPLTNAYTYQAAPTVSSISPSTTDTAAGNVITVNGTGFVSGAVVRVGNQDAVTTFISATQLSFVAPTGVPQGPYTITVMNGNGGVLPLYNALTYTRPAPTITNLTQDFGIYTGGKTSTINGTNFFNGRELRKVVTNNSGGTTVHTCGITPGGKLYCWGYNNTNQLGDGTTTQSPLPIAVDTSASSGLNGKTVIDVAAGQGHTCALTSENKVYCWGANGNNQLGDGTTTQRTLPTLVDPSNASPMAGKKIVAITAGQTYTCALSSEGKAYCWGNNNNGQLGDNTTTQRALPVQVDAGNLSPLGSAYIAQLSSGVYHTCAVTTEGKVYCWGVNGNGQLGDGTTTQRLYPVLVDGIDQSPMASKVITNVSAGYSHTCAVDSTGKAYCWGDNSYGQLGDNTVTQRLLPSRVDAGNTTLGAKTITSLSTGNAFTCAAAADGSSYCWGLNSNNQLGDGTTTQRNLPYQTASPLTGKSVVQMSAGTNYTCAVTSEVKAYCWGYNTRGNLGDNSTTGRATATSVNETNLPGLIFDMGGALATNVTYVSPTAISIVSPAHLAGWVTGTLTNGDYQVATKTNAYEFLNPLQVLSASPYNISLAGGDVVTLTGIGFHSTLTSIQVNGVTTPVTYVNSSTLTFTAPASATRGPAHITVSNPSPDAQVATKYAALYYQYATPSITSISPSYGPTAGGTNVTLTGSGFYSGKEFSQVYGSSMGQFMCGITMNSRIYCWGANGNGQLGDNSTTNRLLPTLVDPAGISPLAGKTVTKLSLGSAHTCAITTELTNNSYCWGNNGNSQLGDNTTNQRLLPIRLSLGSIAGKQVTDIAAGSGTTCAVTTDGQAHCWGYNYNGQLGNGGTTNGALPAVVDAGNSSGIYNNVGSIYPRKIMSISTGPTNTCATTNDYRVFCWGYNDTGGIGVGNGVTSGANVVYPFDISGYGSLSGKKIAQVSVGYQGACALTIETEARVHCWGYGAQGNLGNNSGGNQPYPVLVDPSNSSLMAGKKLTSLSRVGNSADHVCATSSDYKLYCWGYNGYNNVTNTTTANQLLPVETGAIGTLNGKSITQVATTIYATCALTTETKLYCWGLNGNGQLGDNSTNNRTTPTLVNMTNLPGVSVLFDGLPATNPVVVSPTSITATTPAHAAGPVDVKVVNGDGRSYTTPVGAYVYGSVASAPRNLTASPQATMIDLSWTAPLNDGQNAITDYRVEYSSDSGTTWQVFNDGVSTNLSTSVTGLTAGTAYQFRVQAINTAGPSPYSNIVTEKILYMTFSFTANTVGINLLPAGYRVSSAPHNISIDTNNAAGYRISLSMEGTNRNLVGTPSGQFTPSAGTLSSPQAGLALNTWGYRLNGAGGFGTGTTTEDNVTSSSYSWAGVPALASPDLIKNVSSRGAETFNVWYGMAADATTPQGSYTGTVVYTAVAN